MKNKHYTNEEIEGLIAVGNPSVLNRLIRQLQTELKELKDDK